MLFRAHLCKYLQPQDSEQGLASLARTSYLDHYGYAMSHWLGICDNDIIDDVRVYCYYRYCSYKKKRRSWIHFGANCSHLNCKLLNVYDKNLTAFIFSTVHAIRRYCTQVGRILFWLVGLWYFAEAKQKDVSLQLLQFESLSVTSNVAQCILIKRKEYRRSIHNNDVE